LSRSPLILWAFLTHQLLSNLGRKISESAGEARKASIQRCLVLVQRFNAILLHDSLPAYDCTDCMFVPIFVFPLIFKLPLDYIYRGSIIIIIIIVVVVVVLIPWSSQIFSGSRPAYLLRRAGWVGSTSRYLAGTFCVFSCPPQVPRHSSSSFYFVVGMSEPLKPQQPPSVTSGFHSTASQSIKCCRIQTISMEQGGSDLRA